MSWSQLLNAAAEKTIMQSLGVAVFGDL
jgi:hypothetical protein